MMSKKHRAPPGQPKARNPKISNTGQTKPKPSMRLKVESLSPDHPPHSLGHVLGGRRLHAPQPGSEGGTKRPGFNGQNSGSRVPPRGGG